MAGTPSDSPGTPSRSVEEDTAAATTTVGMTKATTARASMRPLPQNRNLASTQAPGRATRSVRTVEAAASHTVNQSTDQNRESLKTWPNTASSQ